MIVGVGKRINSSNTSPSAYFDLELQENGYKVLLYKVIVPILFGAVTIVGFTGNALVLYVISTKLQLQTVTNLLLSNLAVADLVFVCVVPPFTAYQVGTRSWPFGDAACRGMHYLVNVTAYVTIYTLVLIAVTRCTTIMCGFGATACTCTRRNVLAAIAGIWILMLAANVPILASYSVRVGYSGRSECDVLDNQTGQRIFMTFFCFAYILPLAGIGVLSLCMLHHINPQRTETNANVKSKSTSRMHRVSKLLMLVIVIFAISWLPINIHLLALYFGFLTSNRIYDAVSVLWNVLAYSNSCINPFIYNYTSKDFRDAFKKILPTICTRATENETTNDPLNLAAQCQGGTLPTLLVMKSINDHQECTAHC